MEASRPYLATIVEGAGDCTLFKKGKYFTEEPDSSPVATRGPIKAIVRKLIDDVHMHDVVRTYETESQREISSGALWASPEVETMASTIIGWIQNTISPHDVANPGALAVLIRVHLGETLEQR